MVKLHVLKFREGQYLGTHKTFSVHKNFICHYSQFFENRLRTNSELKLKAVEVDTTDDIVGIFVNWLYTKALTGQNGKQLTCAQLVYLLIYAKLWSAPVLQNHVLRELNQARIVEKRIPSGLLNFMWEYTDPDSPIRRYIVDTWHNSIIASPDKYPQGLLFEIVRTIRTRPQVPKLVLSPKELEKYYVSEKYCPWPVPESEDESSSDEDSESPGAIENEATTAPNRVADSTKRKRPELEELLMKPWGFQVHHP